MPLRPCSPVSGLWPGGSASNPADRVSMALQLAPWESLCCRSCGLWKLWLIFSFSVCAAWVFRGGAEGWGCPESCSAVCPVHPSLLSGSGFILFDVASSLKAQLESENRLCLQKCLCRDPRVTLGRLSEVAGRVGWLSASVAHRGTGVTLLSRQGAGGGFLSSHHQDSIFSGI